MKQRKSTRLKEYDYSKPGWYYITICTKDMISCFGEIKNGKMILNGIGKIAEKFWREIPNHYSETELDDYIIMPNHIHGIVIINEHKTVGDEYFRPENEPKIERANVNVGTRHALSLQNHKHSLSNIIASFKSSVSKKVHELKYNDFAW